MATIRLIEFFYWRCKRKSKFSAIILTAVLRLAMVVLFKLQFCRFRIALNFPEKFANENSGRKCVGRQRCLTLHARSDSSELLQGKFAEMSWSECDNNAVGRLNGVLLVPYLKRLTAQNVYISYPTTTGAIGRHNSSGSVIRAQRVHHTQHPRSRAFDWPRARLCVRAGSM